MDGSNMAELRFEAPLATFDMDEWNEFVDDGGPTPCDVKQNETMTSCSQHSNSISEDNKEDFENENLSGSLEDLVNTFDAKIIKCFKNFSEQSEAIAPIQTRGEEDLLTETQTWWTLTGQYGNIYPIDWTKSCMVSELRNREEESFSQAIVDSGVVDDNQDGMIWSEDSCDFRDEMFEDPLVTADQVISELDEFLDQNSHEHKNRLHRKNFVSRILSSDHLRLTKKFFHREGKTSDDSALKNLSVGALLKMREEMNRSILEYSEVLIRELDSRDELEYEKELKNQFIWLLITIQKRRKELLLQSNNINNNNNGGGCQEVPQEVNNNKTKQHGKAPVYLTTVIPFKRQLSPPSIDILLVFIRILTAINENSPATPALLTDYILKILCPAA